MQKLFFALFCCCLPIGMIWAQNNKPATELKAELVNSFMAHQKAVEYVSFDKNGSLVATGGHDNLIHIKDLNSTRPITVLTGHTGLINDLKFLNNGKQLLSASSDGTVKLWDVATATALKTYANAPAYSLFKEVYFLALTADEKILYFGGKNAKINRIELSSDNTTPQQVFVSTFHITCGIITNDQKYLAFGCGEEVQLLNLANQKIDKKLSYPNGFINDLQQSKDGKLLAAWCEDGVVSLWDYANLKPVGTIAAGYKSYCHIDFSPDSRYLATANKANNFCIWDVASRKLLLEVPHHTASITTLQFAPQATPLQILVGSRDASATIWKISEPTPPPPPEPIATQPVMVAASKAALNNTNIVTKTTLRVASQDVVLDVWDDEQEDGDVLSLVLNEQPLLENYKLIKIRKSLKIHLESNITNLLIMYAKDLGKTPPNTAALSIYDGKRTRIVRLSSDFKDSQAIGIVYDPQAK